MTEETGEPTASPESREPRDPAASSGMLPGSAPAEAAPQDRAGDGAPSHCRMCGHPLRDRVSRMWGLGPDCRTKLRLRLAPVPPDVEIDQDTLPGT